VLVRVLAAAVNGIEAFPVEAEVNSGWGETIVLFIVSISPNFNRPFSRRTARQLRFISKRESRRASPFSLRVASAVLGFRLR
jgi:hypothetical protein